MKYQQTAIPNAAQSADRLENEKITMEELLKNNQITIEELLKEGDTP